MESHDDSCELTRPDWPSLKVFVNPVTGVIHPAQPYPCHCLARTQGRDKARRFLARTK